MSDIVDKFSSHLKNVLTRALCFVVESHHKTIQPEHLLWALGTEKGCIASELIKKAGIKQTALRKLVGAKQGAGNTLAPPDLSLHLSEDAKRIVEKAVLTANIYGHRYIGTEHLLAGVLQIETTPTTQFFINQNTDLKELKDQLAIVLKSTSKFPDLASTLDDSGQTSPQTPTATATTITKTDEQVSALEYFARELTNPTIQTDIDPVIGREDEIERMMEILCRRTKNNPLLLGEPGVGKTAIVEGLAKDIVEGRAPAVLRDKKIYALDMAAVIAGTMYRGEFESRIRQIIDEVKADPNTILFIDEIHTIVGAGSASGSMDAANLLKPALARGEIRCIGATTPAEYKKHIESDTALERRFQALRVEEPTKEKALEILQGVAPYYEQYHHVRFTPEALEQAVSLSHRYIQDRQLPDKAIDLIDEAAAATRIKRGESETVERERELHKRLDELKQAKRQAVVEELFDEALSIKQEETNLRACLAQTQNEPDNTPVVTISHDNIARVIAKATGIPVEDMLADNHTHITDLTQRIEGRVLGQDHVIQTVLGALKRAKTGVAHPHRPLASFMFLGPSGVGKTELARVMAKALFHNPNNFIRLDMSEYANGFTISKLIGAPAGYVGYKESANLTDRVKQHPYSVVLFDEIEKAHRNVQNLLLQILEEGALTDATGRTVNFKNTIVIMTSNVGLERFERGGVGFHDSDTSRRNLLEQDLRTELEERFRPELINRIDHTCVFNPLTQEAIETIAHKQLRELETRLAEQGLHVTITPELTTHVAGLTKAEQGARNIRAHIQREIEHKIAERLTKKDRPRKLNVKLTRGKISVVKA